MVVHVPAVATTQAFDRLVYSDELLAKVAADDPSITLLIMRDQELKKEHAEAIAQALITNTHIYQLDLQGNKIGIEGAAKIAGAMKHNWRIQRVDLRGNNLATAPDTLKMIDDRVCRNRQHALCKEIASNDGGSGRLIHLEKIKAGPETCELVADSIKFNSIKGICHILH